MRPVIRLLMVVALFLGTSNVPLFAQRLQRIPGPLVRQPFSPNVMFLNGNFAHATLGSFNPTNDAFVPSRMGSSLLTAQGFFMPTTGTFVPTRTGNFVLTTRESFDPKTKTFVPSPTGNFVLSTRGDLVSSTTKMLVGSIVPATTLTVPTAFTNPYSAMLNPYAAGLSNPYMMAMSGTTPYSMTPYGSYSMPMYGTPYGNTAPTSATAVAATKSAADAASDKQTQVALGAYGIPTEDGHVKWPLAFRLLPPEKKSELTDTLENQLLAMAGGSSGSSNSTVLRGAKQSVQRLSAWLDEHKTNLAETTYQDGRDFLRRIDATLTTLTY
ncbi:MAG TPA: hypothetical protein VNX28_01365 [Gemmataceae bacterium]|jgi:hypothetical protein|nr:hypothetical protein [Gemmataceae bacterium]